MTVEDRGSRTIKRSATWSAHKKILTPSMIMTIGGSDYRADYTYKLSDNGLVLTVNSETKDSNGGSTDVWVYNRKKKQEG